MIGDFHIHSYYSKDSINSPKIILKMAKKRGLDIVAVTDHDTIKGGISTQKLAGNTSKIKVLVGAEIRTNMGDIIGINLTNEIQSRSCLKVIDEIHNQGGFAILPHPYRDHDCIDEIVRYVDFIEVWNARSNESENNLAIELARKNRSIMKICGSDAHLPFEIGNVKWNCNDSMKENPKGFQHYANKLDILCSIGIRRVRSCIHI